MPSTKTHANLSLPTGNLQKGHLWVAKRSQEKTTGLPLPRGGSSFDTVQLRVLELDRGSNTLNDGWKREKLTGMRPRSSRLTVSQSYRPDESDGPIISRRWKSFVSVCLSATKFWDTELSTPCTESSQVSSCSYEAKLQTDFIYEGNRLNRSRGKHFQNFRSKQSGVDVFELRLTPTFT